MAKVYDIVGHYVNLSIDKAEEMNDERYKSDFYKLQFLMYFAQWKYMFVNKRPLFEDEIYAISSGPILKELFEIPFGTFQKINNKLEDIFPITSDREELLKEILRNYGYYSADKLHSIVIKTKPYQIVYTQREKYVSKELFKKYRFTY